MTTRQDKLENSLRISVPNVSARALPWYLTVFTAITAYLTVTNTLFVVVTEKISGWQGYSTSPPAKC
jgi:hypothetical protein